MSNVNKVTVADVANRPIDSYSACNTFFQCDNACDFYFFYCFFGSIHSISMAD